MQRGFSWSLLGLGSVVLLGGCARPPDTVEAARRPSTLAPAASSAEQRTDTPSPGSSNPAAKLGPPAPKRTDPVLPPGATFVEVGRHWASLKRICALAPLGNSLLAAHARGALSIDGATVTRYSPAEDPPFTLAFDWNRRGQPVKGGGAGQGFLRLRNLDGRLYLPDADPPYVGFRLSGKGIEGYVFVSDTAGKFARSRHPNHLPPAPPTDEAPGAAVLPYAYHVFDVARFHGRIYASGGAHASGGAAPGALFAPREKTWTWEPVAHFPDPPDRQVWRLTFMSVFGDRLYVGVETFATGDPTDYVSFELNDAAASLTSADGHVEHSALEGGASTLRWRVDEDRLYWIASHAYGVTLQASRDGRNWDGVPLPPEAGLPLDLVRFRGALVILTERRLLQLREGILLEVARVEGKKSPFQLDDLYCPAPLAVFDGELYAGGQHKGRLYRLTWPDSGDSQDAGPAAK